MSMGKRVGRVAVITATTVLGLTLLWSLWEWRRLSRIAVDLAKAQNLQYDISLPPGLFGASTIAGGSRMQAAEKTQVILVGSSNSPLTAQSTPRWERFLNALGAYDLTLVTFDRTEVFENICRLKSQTGQTPKVLTIIDPATFVLRTGINAVPFTIVAASPDKVVGLIAGVPTDAILNRVIQQLDGAQRTVVGLGAGDMP